jgi:anti-sigma factor RsiW
VQKHVAHCPRCQRRLAAFGRVDLALSVVKSQPHRLDLLRRANAAAVRMLSHDLREQALSHQLQRAQAEPSLTERCARHQNVITSLAACLAIVILTKAGIFSSFTKVNTYGPSALKQYYADRAGQDLANEVFKG